LSFLNTKNKLCYLNTADGPGNYKKRKELAGENASFCKYSYFFFKYGKPVLLLTPTEYPFGMSHGLPLFGFLLLKKYIV